MTDPTPTAVEAPSTLWIVIDVGCLCCDTPSAYVGTYADESEARKVAATLSDALRFHEGCGPHEYRAWPVPAPGPLAEVYRRALAGEPYEEPDEEDVVLPPPDQRVPILGLHPGLVADVAGRIYGVPGEAGLYLDKGLRFDVRPPPTAEEPAR